MKMYLHFDIFKFTKEILNGKLYFSRGAYIFCSSNATISSKMLKHFYTILQCLEEHGSQFMLHIFTND